MAAVDDESFVIRRNSVVHQGAVRVMLDVLCDQYFKIVDLVALLFPVWLVQSQSQLGAASAMPLDENTQILARVFDQDFLQFRFGDVGYFNHLGFLFDCVPNG